MAADEHDTNTLSFLNSCCISHHVYLPRQWDARRAIIHEKFHNIRQSVFSEGTAASNNLIRRGKTNRLAQQRKTTLSQKAATWSIMPMETIQQFIAG